ncbi:MAG: peroxiredoxin [Rhodobacteraceae bacterium]|nr:peroxiredoxin [Paracoccaceae bacterium]
MGQAQTISPVLPGTKLPDMTLPSTAGGDVNLRALQGLTVIYAYPRTSPPNAAPIEGWDQITGARGCTPQSCSFRDHYAELLAAGVAQIFGLSTQDTVYQSEVVTRLHLPFALLSDLELGLGKALGLELFEAGGMTLLKRITLILRDGKIEHVFFPVSKPAHNAEEVIAYLEGK